VSSSLDITTDFLSTNSNDIVGIWVAACHTRKMAITEDAAPVTDTAVAGEFGDSELDWGDADEVLTCGIENPDECEACT